MSFESGESTNNQPVEPLEAGNPGETNQSGSSDWKNALRRNFESWLAGIEEAPDIGAGADKEPDLYSFYEQLTILSTESRKSNRRTAEAFSQWSGVLERFEAELTVLRNRVDQTSADGDNPEALSRKHCLAMIELLDRLLRLQESFGALEPKRRRLMFKESSWRQAWHSQKEACRILIAHFEALLSGEGVERIECLGRAFNPAIMAAAAVEQNPAYPNNTVLEEMNRGYLRDGELLRYAQVRVNAPPQDASACLPAMEEKRIHE